MSLHYSRDLVLITFKNIHIEIYQWFRFGHQGLLLSKFYFALEGARLVVMCHQAVDRIDQFYSPGWQLQPIQSTARRRGERVKKHFDLNFLSFLFHNDRSQDRHFWQNKTSWLLLFVETKPAKPAGWMVYMLEATSWVSNLNACIDHVGGELGAGGYGGAHLLRVQELVHLGALQAGHRWPGAPQ